MKAPVGIVCHWAASGYRDVFDAYHNSIAYDEVQKRACVVRNLKSNQKGKHAWGRNSGLLGNSFSAMSDTHAPITAQQIEAMSQLLAEQCLHYKLDPAGHVTLQKMKSNDTQIWAVDGFISVPVIMDHAILAKNDGYYPERTDIGSQDTRPGRNYLAQVTARAISIHKSLKAGTSKTMFDSII
jgi:hypothetical protein